MERTLNYAAKTDYNSPLAGRSISFLGRVLDALDAVQSNMTERVVLRDPNSLDIFVVDQESSRKLGENLVQEYALRLGINLEALQEYEDAGVI